MPKKHTPRKFETRGFRPDLTSFSPEIYESLYLENLDEEDTAFVHHLTAFDRVAQPAPGYDPNHEITLAELRELQKPSSPAVFDNHSKSTGKSYRQFAVIVPGAVTSGVTLSKKNEAPTPPGNRALLRFEVELLRMFSAQNFPEAAAITSDKGLGEWYYSWTEHSVITSWRRFLKENANEIDLKLRKKAIATEELEKQEHQRQMARWRRYSSQAARDDPNMVKAVQETREGWGTDPEMQREAWRRFGLEPDEQAEVLACQPRKILQKANKANGADGNDTKIDEAAVEQEAGYEAVHGKVMEEEWGEGHAPQHIYQPPDDEDLYGAD